MAVAIKVSKASVFSTIKWGSLALFFLTLFTFLKLPSFQFKNAIQSRIESALQPVGITVDAKETSFSFLFGLRYSMKDATVRFLKSGSSVQLTRLDIKPRLLPLLLAKPAASAYLEQGESELNLDFKGDATQASFSFDADKADLLKLGLIDGLSMANANPFGILDALRQPGNQLLLSGQGAVSGDLQHPNTLDGKIALDLNSISLAKQKIMGFDIPELKIASGKINIQVQAGKAVVSTIQLGTEGGTDDIVATVSGEIQLGQRWNSGTLDLKTKFKLSEKVMSKFGLIQTLLAAGRLPDGSFSYQIKGPLTSPSYTPLK